VIARILVDCASHSVSRSHALLTTTAARERCHDASQVQRRGDAAFLYSLASVSDPHSAQHFTFIDGQLQPLSGNGPERGSGGGSPVRSSSDSAAAAQGATLYSAAA
jgi:hypothetical protein